MSEITVVLKDSDRTYRQKFLSYQDFTVNDNDPFLIDCINEAKKNFEGEPEEIIIKIQIQVQ